MSTAPHVTARRLKIKLHKRGIDVPIAWVPDKGGVRWWIEPMLGGVYPEFTAVERVMIEAWVFSDVARVGPVA